MCFNQTYQASCLLSPLKCTCIGCPGIFLFGAGFLWLQRVEATLLCGSRLRGLSSWSRHVESSQRKDWTCILCFGRQILNHWTTRGVLLSTPDCLLSFGLAFQEGCELLHYKRVVLCASPVFPNMWSREGGRVKRIWYRIVEWMIYDVTWVLGQSWSATAQLVHVVLKSSLNFGPNFLLRPPRTGWVVGRGMKPVGPRPH